MKILKCPRLNENVRIDITQENFIAFHECLDDDACPLAGCFSKEVAGTRNHETYSPSKPDCKFGDIA